MAAIKPSMRSTETYTESNFLRLHMRVEAGAEEAGIRQVTLEHLSYQAAPTADGEPAGWLCQTIVDAETMSRDDALFIARSHAELHGIPVIYESSDDDV